VKLKTFISHKKVLS